MSWVFAAETCFPPPTFEIPLVKSFWDSPAHPRIGFEAL